MDQKRGRRPNGDALGRASGRVPPENFEAEVSVLGSIILDNRVLEVLPATFSAQDFHRTPHQVLFEAMLALSAKEQPIDVVTLHEHLRESGRLGAAGGAGYISGLTAGVASTANVTHYAEIVQSKALRRRLIWANAQAIDIAHDETIDVHAVQSKIEELLIAAVANSDVRRRREADVVRELLKRAMNSYDEPSPVRLRTGLATLDYYLRIGEEDLVVVAAPTGGGKSMLLEQIAGEAGLGPDAKPVLIASLEMSGHELGERRLMDVGSLAIDDIRKPRTDAASGKLVDAVELVAATSRVEYLDGCYDLQGILREALRWHRQLLAASDGVEGLAGIFIDYVQIIDLDPTTGDLREQQLAHATRTLKRFAKRHRIPVVIASQLRKTNGKVPTKDDLRESGAIANDANAIVILYIPGLVEGTDEFKKDDKRTVLAILAKQRQGRSWVEVPLIQEFEFARFVEPPSDADEQAPEQTVMPLAGGKRRVHAQ